MKNKILLVVTILFGLMMVNAGLSKIFNYMPQPELTPEQLTLFGAFGTIKWLFPLVAVAEVLGGVLIAIPKFRALGAIVIFPIMIGIIVHHIVHDPSTIGIALGMFAINLWVIFDNKDRYMHLIA